MSFQKFSSWNKGGKCLAKTIFQTRIGNMSHEQFTTYFIRPKERFMMVWNFAMALFHRNCKAKKFHSLMGIYLSCKPFNLPFVCYSNFSEDHCLNSFLAVAEYLQNCLRYLFLAFASSRSKLLTLPSICRKWFGFLFKGLDFTLNPETNMA
jgi:hypothetical protein